MVSDLAAAAKKKLAHQHDPTSIAAGGTARGRTPNSARDGQTGPVARLLVIHHSPTRTLTELTEAALAGTTDGAITGVDVVAVPALDFATGAAGASDLLAADGYLLGTSANFGSMSGALKHVFDSTFLEIGGALDDSGGVGGSTGGRTAGRPFGLYVHGRYDTTGAVRSVLAITGALGWRQGYEVLEAIGDLTPAHREDAYLLGGTIAALLAG